jgi:hypothetical protein
MWRNVTGQGQPLRRHHTQVHAVTGTLGQAAEDFEAQMLGAENGTWIFERAGSVDRGILDLHRLWGFFRDKLALRFVPWLEDAMIAADDLAWACYEPAQRFIPADRCREPPLVYFSGGSRPSLMPRGTPYLVEPLPDGGMREPEFTEAVRSVPVGLIGLPWFQLKHLPDAPLIAHEVGHAVEQDLSLGPRVRQLIGCAVPKRRCAAWQSWAGEVFADVYGVLGCGRGFAAALSALLAAAPRDVAGEVREEGRWGSYPAKTLRVLLVVETLRQIGANDPPQSLADIWRETYPQRPCVEFEDDVAAVTAAVLGGPYDTIDGGGLTSVLSFGGADEERARQLADRLRRGLSPDRGGVREVMAAARLAYDHDRLAYADHEPTSAILTWIKLIPMRGVRAAGGADTPTEDVRARRNEAAGHELAKQLVHAEHEHDQQEVPHVPA